MGGFAGGTLLCYCRGKYVKTHQDRPHPPPSPPGAPLYEEVDLTAGQEGGQELKLRENVAYGHITG